MNPYIFPATHIVSNDETRGVTVQETESGEVAVLFCSQKMEAKDGTEILTDFMNLGENLWQWYISYSE